MTNPEALKALYVALGGDASAVADDNLTVEVLNALAAKFEGEADADTIPEAIENITAVAENIGGGGNPNETGTIEGTVAAPFGELGAEYFIEQMAAGNLSGIMKVDGTYFGTGTINLPMLSSGTTLYIQGATAELVGGSWTTSSVLITYEAGTPALQEVYAVAEGSVTDLRTYAGSISTEIDYIYHPLPEDGNE